MRQDGQFRPVLPCREPGLSADGKREDGGGMAEIEIGDHRDTGQLRFGSDDRSQHIPAHSAVALEPADDQALHPVEAGLMKEGLEIPVKPFGVHFPVILQKQNGVRKLRQILRSVEKDKGGKIAADHFSPRFAGGEDKPSRRWG